MSSNISTLKLSEDTYKNMYEEQCKEVEYIKQFIGNSSKEKIKSLCDENNSLKIENATLKGKVEQAEKSIEAIKTEADKRVKQVQADVNKRIEYAKSSVMRNMEAEYKIKLDNKGYNARADVRRKEVKPAEMRAEAAEKERDRIKEMYEQLLNEHDITHKKLDTLTEKLDENTEKIDTITEYSLEILSVIKQSIVSGESSEKLIEKIDSGIETLNKRECRTKEELEAEDIQIIQMIKDGKSDTDIANIIYEHLSSIQSRRTQLSKRKKTKRFKKLYEELVGN